MMVDDLHNDHVENLVSADPRLQDDRSQLDDQFMVVRNDQRMPQTFAAGHLIISRTYVDHLILFFGDHSMFLLMAQSQLL